MGWNQGYTIFEATVVGAYDLGKLDKELLAVLMEPYADSDIDSGGSCDLVSNDGLDIKEIVLKVWTGELPAMPDKETGTEEEWDQYQDKIYDDFRKVTKEHGWW